MPAPDAILTAAEAPTDRPVETIDVRALGPPGPLQRTLETLASLPSETVLVQRNDREPQFLYPKLEDRGYAFTTLEREEETVTVIWREEP